MSKFQNKYSIQSARLQNWDYRWAGAYFIGIIVLTLFVNSYYLSHSLSIVSISPHTIVSFH